MCKKMIYTQQIINAHFYNINKVIHINTHTVIFFNNANAFLPSALENISIVKHNYSLYFQYQFRYQLITNWDYFR